MSSVIELFPNKKSIIIGEGVAVPEKTKLEFWKSRNELISESFHTSSIYEKQKTLDIVLGINNELYELVLKLKGEI